MSDEQPNAGVGRDIQVEVGRFECVCGNAVIPETPLGDYEEMILGSPNYPFTQDTLDCDECGREWALVDGGVEWVSRGEGE